MLRPCVFYLTNRNCIVERTGREVGNLTTRQNRVSRRLCLSLFYSAVKAEMEMSIHRPLHVFITSNIDG